MDWLDEEQRTANEQLVYRSLSALASILTKSIRIFHLPNQAEPYCELTQTERDYAVLILFHIVATGMFRHPDLIFTSPCSN